MITRFNNLHVVGINVACICRLSMHFLLFGCCVSIVAAKSVSFTSLQFELKEHISVWFKIWFTYILVVCLALANECALLGHNWGSRHDEDRINDVEGNFLMFPYQGYGFLMNNRVSTIIIASYMSVCLSRLLLASNSVVDGEEYHSLRFINILCYRRALKLLVVFRVFVEWNKHNFIWGIQITTDDAVNRRSSTWGLRPVISYSEIFSAL
jgi:hypothetical protein